MSKTRNGSSCVTMAMSLKLFCNPMKWCQLKVSAVDVEIRQLFVQHVGSAIYYIATLADPSPSLIKNVPSVTHFKPLITIALTYFVMPAVCQLKCWMWKDIKISFATLISVIDAIRTDPDSMLLLIMCKIIRIIVSWLGRTTSFRSWVHRDCNNLNNNIDCRF
jgi:hypothetical protein